jgi:hypothetical protein
LTSNNKAGLHGTFWNSLIDFLYTDLDGNLSSTLNPFTASKLDHYSSTFFEGLSETANKGEISDQHMLNEKSKHQFIENIGDIALFATQIPLFIFTNLFHQRFEKHSMLESMHEILQQLYIQMETEPDEFAAFPGDLSTYTFRCIRCGQPVTLAGSIGETLLHAPTAMLYHRNMIESHEEQNHRESMLMPLLFTSYDNYIRPSKSFQEGLNWMEDLKICQIQIWTVLFCEAVEVDMANSKETSFSNKISSTLSLITVVFEDLFKAFNIHKECCDKKQNPLPSISLLNKTNAFDGYNFNNDFIRNVEYNALQKQSLMLIEGCCIFGFWEFYKKLLCNLVEVHKTMYGNNEDVQTNLWTFSF